MFLVFFFFLICKMEVLNYIVSIVLSYSNVYETQCHIELQ